MAKKLLLSLIAMAVVIAVVFAMLQMKPSGTSIDKGNIAKADLLVDDGEISWSLIDNGSRTYDSKILVRNNMVSGNLSYRMSIMNWNQYDYSILLIQSNTQVPDDAYLHSELLAYGAIVPVIAMNNPHGLVSLNETVLRTILFVNGHINESIMPEDVKDAMIWMPHSTSEYVWSEIPAESGDLNRWCSGDEKAILPMCDQDGELAGLMRCTLGAADDVRFNQSAETGSYSTMRDLGTYISSNKDALAFFPIGMIGKDGASLQAIPFANDSMVLSGIEPLVPGVAQIRDMSYPGDFKVMIYGTGQRPVADNFHSYILSGNNNLMICESSGFVSPYVR